MTRPHVLLASPSNEGLAVAVDLPQTSYASAHTRGLATRLEGQSQGLFDSFRQAGDLAWRVLMGSPLAAARGAGEPSRFAYRLQAPDTEQLVDEWCSADLAFFITALLDRLAQVCDEQGQPISPIAATGQLFDAPGKASIAVHSTPIGPTPVLAVGGIEAKLRAALVTLSPLDDARILIPHGNLIGLSPDLCGWVERGVIVPVRQIQDVLDALKSLPELPGPMRDVLNDLHAPIDANPYRGIEAFGIEHRGLYFGRRSRIDEVLSKLPSALDTELPAVLITGFSGSGKSSLLLAGVLGTVLYTDVRGHRFLPRPGLVVDTSAIACRIPARADIAEGVLCATLREHWQGLLGTILAPCHSLVELADQLIPILRPDSDRPARWVLALDQLEALVTQGGSGERHDLLKQFALHLERLIRDAGVWVLATVRTGYLEALGPLWKHIFHVAGHVDLSQPTTPEPESKTEAERWTRRENEHRTFLHEVIERPAQLAGFELEDGLLDDIVRDARDPQSLPLLQFALQGLYEYAAARHNQGGLAAIFTRTDYDTIGGIRGAINQRASELLDEAGADREVLLGALARLAREQVHANGQHEYVRTTMPWSSYSPHEQALLLPWLSADHRLLTRHEDQVEVAHEALLREFTALRDWLLRHAQVLHWRQDYLLPQVRRWVDDGKGEELLLLARDDLEHGRLALNTLSLLAAQELEFIERSIEAAERRVKLEAQREGELKAVRRRVLVRTQTGLAVATALLAVAVVLGIRERAGASRLNEQVNEAALRAVGRASDALMRGGYSEYHASLIESLMYVDTPAARAAAALVLQGHGLSPATRMIRVTLHHGSELESVRFAANSQAVITTDVDGHTRWWDARTGTPQEPQADTSANPLWTLSVQDTEVRVLDTRTGQMLGRPMQHESPVRLASVSSDGRWMVSANVNGLVDVWDVATGESTVGSRWSIPYVTEVQFSPDGSWLLAASYLEAMVWRTDSGEPLDTYSLNLEAKSGQFSPDGQRMVLVSKGDLGADMVYLWDLATNQPIGAPVRTFAEFIRFSPDGRWLAISGSNGLTVLDAETGHIANDWIHHTSPLVAVEFSVDGRWIATASREEAQVWDAETGGRVGEKVQHDGSIVAVAFSPDGRQLATAEQGGITRVWSTQATSGIPMSLHHEREVNVARFSPDGAMVATASLDGTARLWDAQSGMLLRELIRSDHDVNLIEFTPDGRRVLVAIDDSTIRMFDTLSGEATNRELMHDASIWSVQLNSNSQRLITQRDDETLQVWGIGAAQPIAAVTHQGGVSALRLSPDGRWIASAGDNVVRVWEAQTGKPVAEFATGDGDANALAFSSDGRWLAVASGDSPFQPGLVQVWDAHTGTPRHDPILHAMSAQSIEFSPDGRWVVTAGGELVGDVLRIWDAQTGSGVAGPVVFTGDVSSVHFSSDGRRIVTAHWDATARIVSFATDLGADGERLAGALRALSGVEVDSDGQLRALPPSERIVARGELKRAAKGDTPFDDVVRWHFAEPTTRAIAPLAGQSVPQFVENAIDAALKGGADATGAPAKAKVWLDEAYKADPGHPLILLALSVFEDNPATVRLWRELSLQRIGSDGRLAAKAVEILQRAGDADFARRATQILLALESANSPASSTSASEDANAGFLTEGAGAPLAPQGTPVPEGCERAIAVSRIGDGVSLQLDSTYGWETLHDISNVDAVSNAVVSNGVFNVAVTYGAEGIVTEVWRAACVGGEGDFGAASLDEPLVRPVLFAAGDVLYVFDALAADPATRHGIGGDTDDRIPVYRYPDDAGGFLTFYPCRSGFRPTELSLGPDGKSVRVDCWSGGNAADSSYKVGL